MRFKEQILKLRSEGKSYREIQKILGCHRSNITYHCGKDQKIKSNIRHRKYMAKQHPATKKVSHFKEKRLYDKVRTFHNDKSKKETAYNFTVNDVLQKFKDNPRCYLSGKYIDLNDPSSYQFDHIVPISRGGSCNLTNLGLTTKTANNAKYNLTPEEFIELCKEILIYQGYTITK